jgi:hypothetical protein
MQKESWKRCYVALPTTEETLVVDSSHSSSACMHRLRQVLTSMTLTIPSRVGGHDCSVAFCRAHQALPLTPPFVGGVVEVERHWKARVSAHPSDSVTDGAFESALFYTSIVVFQWRICLLGSGYVRPGVYFSRELEVELTAMIDNHVTADGIDVGHA